MRYFQKIAGERIYLSPINVEDVQIYTKWMNDPAVSVGLGNYSKLYSELAERDALERLASGGYNFAIVKIENNALIGNAGFSEINHISRSATIGLFIGESDDRGRGYGAEALILLLGYGFKTLNLHNVMLKVFANNEPAIACYKKVGFKEFGRRSEACFQGGRYVDDVFMEILDRDYHTLYG